MSKLGLITKGLIKEKQIHVTDHYTAYGYALLLSA